MSKKTQRVYEEKEAYRRAALDWKRRYEEIKRRVCSRKSY